MSIKVLDQLDNIDVMAELEGTGAILEGHFKLSSGLHSGNYLQCAKLLQYPDRTAELVGAALKSYHEVLNRDSIDTVVAPAIGGLFFGYMVACKLGINMVFTERKEGKMQLRRGFEIERGQKVLVAEDVITTGGSVSEVIEICESLGADIKGVICIVDRSDSLHFNYPFYYLIKISIETYIESKCPLCRQNIQIYYPGSRPGGKK
jgi:orotate phosphoribosyltransferase